MLLPTLLVPGLNCSGRIFFNQVPRVWAAGPVTIANHTAGEGVREIAANILAAAPERFALLGYSFGGYLCFEILRQARQRVAKLALLDTSARPDTAEQSENRRRAIALAEAGKFQAVLDQQFPNVVDPSHRGDPMLRSLYMRMAHECGPELFVRHQRSIIARPDSRGELSLIDVPTLIVVGEADTLTPPDASEEMAAGIAGALLVRVPAAGHLAPLEQPDIVNEAIGAWLRP